MIYSKAIYKPITANKGRKRLTAHNRVNLHVAVSEQPSLFGLFNKSGQVDSHFYIRKDGTVEQYVDTDWRAFADLEGNDGTISVETQGGVNNPNSEPWTDAQVQALADLFRWVRATHGVANKIASNSFLGEPSKGLSWHRLGVNGNFPSGSLGGRLQHGGGMKYSKAGGKICPGDAKIRQVQRVFDLSQTTSTPAPAPAQPAAPAKPVTGSGSGKQYAKIAGYQAAVKAAPDDWWGPETEKLSDTLRAATTYHGYKFPYGKAAVQRIIGVTPDGIWGPKSKAAHDKKVAEVQRILGVNADGIWGPVTEAAYLELRKNARKP